MDKFDRVFQLHAILSGHRTAVQLEDLMARLECSKATVHRIISLMRDHCASAYGIFGGVADKLDSAESCPRTRRIQAAPATVWHRIQVGFPSEAAPNRP